MWVVQQTEVGDNSKEFCLGRRMSTKIELMQRAYCMPVHSGLLLVCVIVCVCVCVCDTVHKTSAVLTPDRGH